MSHEPVLLRIIIPIIPCFLKRTTPQEARLRYAI